MQALPILNEHAAGIDVGSESLHVSIAGEVPQVFGTMTCDLQRLKDYLLEHTVSTVAMEATGVYWLCAYEVLEGAGIEVLVVNGRHVKNIPGRKSDMADCQWLATLHAHGLLRSGFVPSAEIRRLQDYLRLRQDKIAMAASHVQHMQQALERMNVKFHDVITKLTGASGLAVIRAILQGERDPQALLQLCDRQIRKKKAAAVCESLRGTWKAEHLFALRQAMLHGLLMKLCGQRDPTALPGITDYTLLQLIGEVGTDLTRWPTAKHFTAWTGLAPGSHQSGKRRSHTSRQRNRAGRIFCVLAQSLARSVDKALGGFYRRLRARRGGLIANQALARKLAALFWQVMVHGVAYVEQGLKHYEARVLETEQRVLHKLARKHGLILQPATP